MLNKKNKHFEKLCRIEAAYVTIKRDLEQKKEEIIKTHGWESQEMKDLQEKISRNTYPISMGACKAYRAYKQSLEKNTEELEMSDFLWDNEVEDFLDTLKKAEINSFIYTNQSTAVMENMHAFEEQGCRMVGLKRIKRLVQKYGAEEIETTLGVLFAV